MCAKTLLELYGISKMHTLGLCIFVDGFGIQRVELTGVVGYCGGMHSAANENRIGLGKGAVPRSRDLTSV